MDTYELIKQAVKNKQQVVTTYIDCPREKCSQALGTRNEHHNRSKLRGRCSRF
jgi:hypothetical protein